MTNTPIIHINPAEKKQYLSSQHWSSENRMRPKDTPAMSVKIPEKRPVSKVLEALKLLVGGELVGGAIVK